MGVKKNFAYSAVLTCSGYVFAFITYPYVSRVLGVENIGICNFVSSIVQYFLLFSTMGIASVGTREIAKCNGDKEKLSRCFSSLVAINMIFTAVVSVVYLACIFLVPELYTYRRLLYVGLLQIVLTPFLIEWFYKGIETFRYITVRSLIVKILYVIAVFLFVRKPEDYGIYFFLSCAMMVVNAGFNWIYKNRFVGFNLNGVTLRPYMRGVIVLGIYALLTSMYTTFNTAYLGFVCGNEEVGYYSTAMKIQSVILAIYTAFTGVMVPRMSSLIGQNREDDVKRLIYKSFDALFVFSIPLVVFSMAFAPQIVRIIAGAGYEQAVLPMRTIMPLILIVGIEQILVLQILLPLKEDKAILVNSIVGASVSLITNCTLVPAIKSEGSAIVSLVSEIAVMTSAYHFIWIKYGNLIPFKVLFKNLLGSLPIVVILLCINSMQINLSIALVGIAIIVYCWTIQFYIIKDPVVISLTQKYANAITKRLRA